MTTALSQQLDTEFDVLEDKPVGSVEDLVLAMETVQKIHVSDTFIDHVVEIVGRTRTHSFVPRSGSRLDPLQSHGARIPVRDEER